MPRPSQPRGNPNASYRGRGRGRSHHASSMGPLAGASTPTASQNGFTLQEEARNTERHHTWDPNTKLRFTKVNFVSAGCLDSSEPKKPESPGPATELNQGSTSKAEPADIDTSVALESKVPELTPLLEKSAQNDTAFGIELQTSSNLPVRSRTLPERVPSPTPSDSSEEVILFTGRARSREEHAEEPQLSGGAEVTIDSKIQRVEDEIHEQKELLEATVQNPIRADKLFKSPEQIFPDHEQSKFPDPARHPRRRSRKVVKRSQNQALITDYIENMDSDIKEFTNGPFGQRPLDDLQTNLWQATSDDEPVTYSRATKAGKKSAAEYQVPEEESSTDSDIVEKDEMDELVEKLCLRDLKDHELSDAQIARLLAQQDGSAALQLGEETGEFDEMLASRKSGGRKNRRARGEYPSATALADAYDGFDVMDFDRPSLRRKSKGQKVKPAFDLSDSELEESMQMAWSNDRLKKKERKQERERLRSEGMLGKKKSEDGLPDLKQKYKDGISTQDIRKEIMAFLMRSDTTLTLPPMGKEDRKYVHELANAFDLKSKSAGAGDNRFPILSRTRRTRPMLNDGTFAAIEGRLARRYLRSKTMDDSGKKPIRRSTARGGGFNNAAVSHRDGDIVGASAPELGIDNKGRAMMEKMGWSTGTALGAINNKGILLPVPHVVKTSKAGLG